MEVNSKQVKLMTATGSAAYNHDEATNEVFFSDQGNSAKSHNRFSNENTRRYKMNDYNDNVSKSSETVYKRYNEEKPVFGGRNETTFPRATPNESMKLDVCSSATPSETITSNSPPHRRHTHSDFRKKPTMSFKTMPNSTVTSKTEPPNISDTISTSSLRKAPHQRYKIFPNRRAKFARHYQLKSNKYKVQPSFRSVLPRDGLQKYSQNPSSSSQQEEPNSRNSLDILEHQLEPETAKTKLKTLWNTIIYGWSLQSKSSFKYDSPMFILGKCYHKRKAGNALVIHCIRVHLQTSSFVLQLDLDELGRENDESTLTEDEFLRDFVSRIWLTYRRNFYPIPGSRLSTDCGWGCMLRSGQMLIAQSLVTHFLGRDWRLYNKQTDTDSVFYREIIRWFSDPLDTPSDKTPFCLHHLASYGRMYNKYPGDWYGPSSVALVFRDAFQKASQSVPVLSQICLYVAQDCTVVIEDVLKLCTKKQAVGSHDGSLESETDTSKANLENAEWQRSLILLIPMRLGADVTNEIYFPCVKSLLSHDNCMGIMGGKPRHSLYFLGWQDNKLLYLDPHLCRDAVDTTALDFKTETFHCKTPRKLPMHKMDPSCTVGFYIKNASDFQNFVQDVKEFIAPPKQRNVYPLFTFSDGHRGEASAGQRTASADKRLRIKHYHVDEYGQKTFAGESEEFVVL